jgi:Domain of unknown function (DUF4145)
MASQEIEPRLGAESFSCPHCNAVAHHDWFSLFLKPENATEIAVLTLEAAMLAKGEEGDELIERLKDNVLTYEYQDPRTLKVKLVNLHVSRCYSCKGFAIWVRDRLVFPIRGKEPPDIIEGDFKEVIKGDFKEIEEDKTADDIQEATAIFNSSPKGAAALIRICIRKMMPLLEQSSKSLDDNISSLVRKGLEVEIQQSMDLRQVLRQSPLKPTQFDEEGNETATRMFASLKEILKRLKNDDEK